MAEKGLPLAALLGRGAKYSGEMSFDGRVRVDGTFTGSIFTEDRLEIGESGVVDGKIDAATLVVAGTAKGNLRIRDLLIVESTGKVYGKVDAGNMQVEPGARIKADIQIGIEPSAGLGETG